MSSGLPFTRQLNHYDAARIPRASAWWIDIRRSEIRLDQAHQRQWHGMPVFVSVGAEIRDHNIALAIHKQHLPGKSALEDLAELAHAIPLIAGMAEPGWLLLCLQLETFLLQ